MPSLLRRKQRHRGDGPCPMPAGQEVTEAAVNPGTMASAIFVIIIVLFVSQDYLIDLSYGG